MTQDKLKLVFDALKQCNTYAFAGGLGLRAMAHRDALAILEKAIAELESQEPMATIAVRWHEPVGKVAYVLEVNLPVGVHKLYTHPPQRTDPVAEDSSVAQKRTWVGLTDEDINEWTPEIHGVIQAIEAKLKHKNGYAEEKNNA